MDIYLKRYARELHGKRPIRNLRWQAAVVELDQPLAVAARHVLANMQFPLTEDFIVTRHGVSWCRFCDGSAACNGTANAGQHDGT